jgi:antiviral helicase SKI2
MDGLAASPASEAPFRISFSGHRGHLRLDPNTPNPGPDFLLVRDPQTLFTKCDTDA